MDTPNAAADEICNIRASDEMPDTIQAASLVSVSTSAAFRIDLRCGMTSKLYIENHTAIQAQHDLLSPVRNGFKDQASIAPQLQKLAQQTHEIFLDAESALEYQKQRHLNLFREENIVSLSAAVHAIESEVSQWVESFDDFKDFSLMDVKSAFSNLKDLDDRFFRAQETKALEEIMADNERESHFYKSAFDSKTIAHIADARLRRLNIIEKKLAALIPESKERGQKDWNCLITKFLDHMSMLFNRWDKAHEAYIRTRSPWIRQRMNAYSKIGSFRQWTISFKNLEKRILSDVNFAHCLTLWKVPLRFLDFPREIRDVIYNELLRFDYNISEKCLVQKRAQKRAQKRESRWLWDYPFEDPTRRRDRRLFTWVHPLFHVSRQVRQEAAEQFYGCNSFASRSLSTLSTPNLPFYFRNLITTLSITWTSLGETSVEAAKALRSFKGLRFLTIYINWSQLRSGIRNSLGGVAALEYILENLMAQVNSLEKVEILEVQLDDKEMKKLTDIRKRTAGYNSRLRRPFGRDIRLRSSYSLHPVLSPRPKMTPKLKELREVLDIMLSSRIFNVQNPGTVYCNGREPTKPSSTWETLNARHARRNKKLGRLHIPIATPLEKSVVKEQLEEIKVTLAEERMQRKAYAASYATALEVLHAEEALDHAINTPLPNNDSSGYDIDFPESDYQELEDFWGSFNGYFHDINGSSEPESQELTNFWSSFNGYF